MYSLLVLPAHTSNISSWRHHCRLTFPTGLVISQNYAIAPPWQRRSALRELHWFPLSPDNIHVWQVWHWRCQAGVQILLSRWHLNHPPTAQSEHVLNSQNLVSVRVHMHIYKHATPQRPAEHEVGLSVWIFTASASSLSLSAEIFSSAPVLWVPQLLSQAQETKTRMQSRGERENKKNVLM